MAEREQQQEVKIDEAVARLRRSAVALMDGEMVIPADGEYLLARLDAAGERVTAGDVAAARSEIERFIDRIRSLEESDILESVNARPRLEAARALHDAMGSCVE